MARGAGRVALRKRLASFNFTADCMLTPQQKAAWLRDPILFQRHVLGRRLWGKQKEIIKSVIENPLTCVKGCHASGKSFVAMGIVPWWITRWPEDTKVFTTAPTLRQVTGHWREIAAAYLGSKILQQMMPSPNVVNWQLGPSRYATGASSSAGVNIAGFHARRVLIVADEAPGIAGGIFDDIEGLRAGGHVSVLEMGNPVISSGHFFDSFTRNRAIYNAISISAFDTPNFQRPDGTTITEDELLALSPGDPELLYCPFPSLITRQWVRERLIVWGKNHPKYLARVLAQFPRNDPYSAFQLDWIEKARRDPTEREIRLANCLWPVQVGIDVAGAGSDETVLTARIGGIIIEQHSWPDADPRGAVAAILNRLAHGKYLKTPDNEGWIERIEPKPLSTVVVDVIGIGYNFALHLGDLGFPVWGFNAGARPIDIAQFVNQKAEAYWAFRSYLKDGEISNLADEETAAQLSTIRYRENSRGLTEIESKEERNRRGIPGSPDRAESVIMSFMSVRPAQRTSILTDDEYQISAV